MKLSNLFNGNHKKKRTIAAVLVVGLAAAALSMLPRSLAAAVTQRDLPIYCVQKDSKVCSLTFDAAWGDAKVRQSLELQGTAALSLLPLLYH